MEMEALVKRLPVAGSDRYVAGVADLGPLFSVAGVGDPGAASDRYVSGVDRYVSGVDRYVSGVSDPGYRILDLSSFAARVIDEAMTPREAAEGFHGALIAALSQWIGAEARRCGVNRIALGGGCVMNRVLTDGLCVALRAQGLTAAIPRKIPANDGGISFGQAAFALNALRTV